MRAKRKLLDGIGIWADFRTHAQTARRPILFLDRDGIINADTGYVGDTSKLKIFKEIGPILRAICQLDVRIVVATNQSGIGRGMYTWQAFEEIQELIDGYLKLFDVQIDAVLACAYHKNGEGMFAVGNHPWRKPNPGMLIAAMHVLNAEAESCCFIGDQDTDILAAQAASLGNYFQVNSSPRDSNKDTFDSASFEHAIHCYLDYLKITK